MDCGNGPCGGHFCYNDRYMDKILLFMETGVSYVTAESVEFSREHPYQLVSAAEAENLLQDARFRTAAADELKSYYNYQVAT